MISFKKIGLFGISAALLFSLSSCADTSYFAKTEDGQINAGIYLSFLKDSYDEASNKEEFNEELDNLLDNKIEDQPLEEWVKQDTQRKIEMFLGVQALFDELNLRLNERDELAAENEVEFFWSYNGKIYEKNGIGQESMLLIALNKFKSSTLFNAYYNTDGIKEIPEQEVKNQFEQDYLSYKKLDFLVSASESDEDKQKIKQQAEEYLDRLKKGEDFSQLIEEHKKATEDNDDDSSSEEEESQDEQELERTSRTLLSRKTAEEKEDETTIEKQIATKSKIGEPVLLSNDSGYYLVLRYSVLDFEETFQENKETVLKSLKQDEFDDFVLEKGKTIPITINEDAIKRYTISKVLKDQLKKTSK